jgi:hypothetical protein
VFGLDILLEAE